MKRRKFITTIGGASAAAAAGAFSILKSPRNAEAAGWGAWPENREDALLEPSLRPRSVLELHVNGGMSCFDTFYTVPEWGRDDNRFLWVHSQEVPGLPTPAVNSIEQRFAACSSTDELYVPLEMEDAAGVPIYLGPWAHPFRNRPDVLDRMRVVVMRHTQVAHEAANPISFTGTALGQPRMAGVGTAIQRYFSENIDPNTGEGGIRAAPYSYVLYPAGYKPFNAVSASSVGFHPGSARPLVVSVDANSELSRLLTRSTVDNEAFDRAVSYYRSTYGARMRAFGHSADVRSAERANYEFATFARQNAPELTEILRQELFAGISPPTEACGARLNLSSYDYPQMQMRMAASLLTRPTNAARYVMVIDAGLRPALTGGHDTHGQAVELNGINLPHTFEALLDIIATPEQIEAGDTEGRINLDETMIVINTEFGRAPDRQGNMGGTLLGTNHWPHGYVNVFIGGPVRRRSVYGNITEASNGVSQTYVNPAENRMMILQALGIYPFSSQSYNVADVQQVEDELEGATRIRDTYLLGET